MSIKCPTTVARRYLFPCLLDKNRITYVFTHNQERTTLDTMQCKLVITMCVCVWLFNELHWIQREISRGFDKNSVVTRAPVTDPLLALHESWSRRREEVTTCLVSSRALVWSLESCSSWRRVIVSRSLINKKVFFEKRSVRHAFDTSSPPQLAWLIGEGHDPQQDDVQITQASHFTKVRWLGWIKAEQSEHVHITVWQSSCSVNVALRSRAYICLHAWVNPCMRIHWSSSCKKTLALADEKSNRLTYACAQLIHQLSSIELLWIDHMHSERIQYCWKRLPLVTRCMYSCS